MEEYLVLVLVGQQKEMQKHDVGDLVVNSLAIQVQKCRVNLNVTITMGSQPLKLLEDANGISSSLNYSTEYV
jgi:hypothetical protein